MPMFWPNYPRSGAEVLYDTFLTPPGQHRIYVGAYASLTGLGLQALWLGICLPSGRAP